jgi:DNA repair exonuclease SbcCD nuclease subunit
MFCGDVHLGRRRAGLPSNLEQQSNLTPSELGPKAALQRAVEAAIHHKVDAFVFAGDVVDEHNSRFEAYGPLREAVAKLLKAGIKTLAVSGNHDVDTLPRLADDLPEFRLIGARGQWEDVLLQGREGAPIALRGWSFPTRRVSESPLLRERPKAPSAVRTVLGVVHGDLDVSGSEYAPLRTRELEAEREVSAWFLGHIHKPSLDARSPRPIGYLGSLSALDRTELDDHGPWLAEVSDSGGLKIEQLALAPLRYEQLDLDLSEWENLEQLDVELLNALMQAGERQEQRAHAARAMGISVRLRGSLRDVAALRALLDGYHKSGLPWRPLESVHAFIAKLENETRPRIDLAARASADDPAGRLAARLLALQDPDSAITADLVAKARRSFELQLKRRSEFAGMSTVADLSEPAVRERLQRAGWRALEALEASREGGLR